MLFLGKNIFVHEKEIVSLKKLLLTFYEVRSERGFQLIADSGLSRYVLRCCGGICQDFFTLI